MNNIWKEKTEPKQGMNGKKGRMDQEMKDKRNAQEKEEKRQRKEYEYNQRKEGHGKQ
jgi:hypothetical protein